MSNNRLFFPKTLSSKYQNIINISIIFNYIYEKGETSRVSISKDLNISAPAVSRVVDKLINDGYVVEREKIRTKGGKRPTLITINKEKGFVVAIDMGKFKPIFAITNFCGEVIKRCEGTKIQNSHDVKEVILSELENFINNCIRDLKLNKEMIKSISIGLPGVVDRKKGKIVSMSLYRGFKDINFKDLFIKKFKIPVFVENDTCLAAIGECRYGKGRDYVNFAFVNISNGVGAGIIISRNLFRGSYDYAGEFGFVIVNDKNLGFKIENKGFLEQFASVESIRDRAIEKIKQGEKTEILNMIKNDITNITPEIVCLAAIKGDHLANRIIKKVVNYLSIGLINLVLFINPQKIFIGGDICDLPEVDKLFLKPIEKNIKNSIPFNTPQLEISSINKDAGILGASYYAIESMLIEEFPYKIV